MNSLFSGLPPRQIISNSLTSRRTPPAAPPARPNSPRPPARATPRPASPCRNTPATGSKTTSTRRLTKTKKPTKSIGGIFNVGWGVSLWANFAQTFNPTDFTRTTIDYGTPPPSTSEGIDYGLRVSFGPRLYLTASRYESKEKDATTGRPSGAGNIQTIVNTNVLGDTSSDGRNRRGHGDMPISWNDVLDRKSQGYELEAVANPLPNWRLTLNLGFADASQTDAFRQTRAWLDANDRVLRQIIDDAGILIGTDNVARADPARPNPFIDATTGQNAWNSLQAGRANLVTGTQALNRLTRYTTNFYSDYRLTSGKLRGLRVGYGMQFRGPQVIGYRGADTIVNPANPALAIDDPKLDAYSVVWQKSYFLGTATLGYPVKIYGNRKIEFNLSITNLFNYDLPLFTTTGLRAPNGDLSTPARTTYPTRYSYTIPRSFRLSATHQF